MVALVSEIRRGLTGSRALFVLVTIALLAPIVSGSLARAIASSEKEDDSFYREFSVFTEVLEHIRKRYVEETDLDALFAGAFDGAVDALDPMATYVPAASASSYRAALERVVERSGLQLVRERGFLFVVAVASGSPGDLAGFKSGDILSQLDGRSTRLMPLWKAQMTLAGEIGTVVSAQVLRQGQMMELEVTLGEFEPTQPTVEMREGVAIVRLGRFDPELVEQLESLLGTPEVAASGRLILDLRSAAGGAVSTAVAAADLFVDGALGALREREAVIETFDSSKANVWQPGRLVLVTNRGSQGASEVFAVLLEQLAGAVSVGGGTFGHAGRSASKTLSSGGELYYTDAFYVAPDGTVLNESLAPDVRVTASSRRLAEADRSLEDLVIDRAIEVALEDAGAVEEAA